MRSFRRGSMGRGAEGHSSMTGPGFRVWGRDSKGSGFFKV